MTSVEIISVVKRYNDHLTMDSSTLEAKSLKDGGTETEHIKWMCEQVATFAHEDIDKANRWLGFIQGYFWIYGDFTIDQMRDHNRSRS